MGGGFPQLYYHDSTMIGSYAKFYKIYGGSLNYDFFVLTNNRGFPREMPKIAFNFFPPLHLVPRSVSTILPWTVRAALRSEVDSEAIEGTPPSPAAGYDQGSESSFCFETRSLICQ